MNDKNWTNPMGKAFVSWRCRQQSTDVYGLMYGSLTFQLATGQVCHISGSIAFVHKNFCWLNSCSSECGRFFTNINSPSEIPEMVDFPSKKNQKQSRINQYEQKYEVKQPLKIWLPLCQLGPARWVALIFQLI